MYCVIILLVEGMVSGYLGYMTLVMSYNLCTLYCLLCYNHKSLNPCDMHLWLRYRRMFLYLEVFFAVVFVKVASLYLRVCCICSSIQYTHSSPCLQIYMYIQAEAGLLCVQWANNVLPAGHAPNGRLVL